MKLIHLDRSTGRPARRLPVVAAIAALGILPALLCAIDLPATRPTASALSSSTRPASLTEEEWDKVVAFMEEFSPNRLRALEENVSPASSRYNSLRRFIYQHYRELSQLKEKNDQELYDLRVRTIQAEDEFWGLRQKLREVTGAEKATVLREMRLKVTEQLMLADKERSLRLGRLEKSLADEKSRLASDREHLAERSEEKFRQLLGRSAPPRPQSSPADVQASPVR